MILINLQHINEPLGYLLKHKLRSLSLPDDYVLDRIVLITPAGVKHELASNISNLEFTELIQLLIDETVDALTVWAEQRSIYVRH